MITHGLHRRANRNARVTAAAAVGTGSDPADPADMYLLAVPGHRPEKNAGVTGERTVIALDEHAQIRVCPFDVTPGEDFHLRLRPRLITVHNFDLDAHGCRASGCNRPIRERVAGSYR